MSEFIRFHLIYFPLHLAMGSNHSLMLMMNLENNPHFNSYIRLYTDKHGGRGVCQMSMLLIYVVNLYTGAERGGRSKIFKILSM